MDIKLKNLIKEVWDSQLELEFKKFSDDEWKYKWSGTNYSGYLVNKKRTRIYTPYDIVKDHNNYFDNEIDYLIRIKNGDKWLVRVVPFNQEYWNNNWYKTSDDALKEIQDLKLEYLNK